jgi:hypothetical protein
MQRTAQSIRYLDLGCIEAASSNYWSLGQHPSRSRLSDLFDGVPQLASITFRSISFAKAISVDWKVFGEYRFVTLRLLNCVGLMPMFSSLVIVASKWSTLHNLPLVLPDVQMHQNHESLRLLDEILCSLPCSSLRRLRVEIPAAEHLPNSQGIARHQKLRVSLLAQLVLMNP